VVVGEIIYVGSHRWHSLTVGIRGVGAGAGVGVGVGVGVTGGIRGDAFRRDCFRSG